MIKSELLTVHPLPWSISNDGSFYIDARGNTVNRPALLWDSVQFVLQCINNSPLTLRKQYSAPVAYVVKWKNSFVSRNKKRTFTPKITMAKFYSRQSDAAKVAKEFGGETLEVPLHV